jgi:hypothetical protein
MESAPPHAAPARLLNTSTRRPERGITAAAMPPGPDL